MSMDTQARNLEPHTPAGEPIAPAERRSLRGPKPYGRRRSDHEPKRGWIPALAIVGGVAVLDWTTKLAVAATVPLEEFVEIWEGRVALWHVRNPEMILGLWGNLPLGGRKVIAGVAGLLALLIISEIVTRGHRLPPHRRIWAWIFVGTAFGGILGNLGERALHWWVTDYLSFAWGDIWLPPGNVADIALFLSIPLAVPVIVFELQARAQRRPHSRPDRRPVVESASSPPA